ncbi:MAG TPA: phosphomannose isomerase type II C-terminal cupin domain [Beijerinckiaceae bacterium]|nr:phosphomannose isomerase type II C-terminal cupin domain [Beijerinckiaceae bacterium]
MNQVVLSHSPSGDGLVRYSAGERDTRPWGTWEVVAVGPNYTLKRIEVRAGQRLSLQYHEFRTEHWTIVAGRGEVEIDGRTRVVEAGDHVHVPLRAPHRIKNIGRASLTFIEVQTGDLLDEADIVRLFDDYGRS